MLFNSKLAAQCVTESQYSKRTQAGIDLSVFKIQKVTNTQLPMLLRDKTVISPEIYVDMPVTPFKQNLIDEIEYQGWFLSPGIYSLTFNEGITVPKNAQAKITHRSSIYRVGNVIESPWWDAGFYCDNMNTTLIVNTSMFVEYNSRVAQVVFWEMYEPDQLYSGQWQGLSGATHRK